MNMGFFYISVDWLPLIPKCMVHYKGESTVAIKLND